MDPFRLQNLLRAATACIFPTSQPPKVVRTWYAFRTITPCTFLTPQRPKAIRGCQFLTLLTSKCASRHISLHFITFSTSQLPKVLRPWGVFESFWPADFQMCFSPQRRALFQHLNFQKCSDNSVPTAACNFWSLIRPDGSAPAALVGPQNMGKHGVSPLFNLFANIIIFFLPESFSSHSFSSLTALTTVAASVHGSEVRSLTSKLPSMTILK